MLLELQARRRTLAAELDALRARLEAPIPDGAYSLERIPIVVRSVRSPSGSCACSTSRSSVRGAAARARRRGRGAHGELGEELRRLGAAEVELRQALAAAAERASAIDVEAARIEAEADEARRRLEQAGPRSGRRATTATSSPRRVERLERRRETLGQVNPLAKEEYDAEKMRLEELTAQRADLEQSLDELEKLRNELTETVERRFAETFDAVAGELRGGGGDRSSPAARAGCG